VRIPRYRALEVTLHKYEAYHDPEPDVEDGFDEYESLLKQSIRISPIAARLIIVNEDYKAIEGKSIYLRGELTSEDGGHIVLLTGFGVDATDRAFWKAQDAYGRGSDKEMMGTQ